MSSAEKAVWRDPRAMSVLGMGAALPGDPLSTEELLARIRTNFGIDVERSGSAIARRLGIQSRHVCRELQARIEKPRAGHSNAELCAQAIIKALAEARIELEDVRYLIAHTSSPGQLIPPNATRIAELLGYDGPIMELRQACTGFANAAIIARGLLDAPSAGPIVIVGSETGSVYFDPRRVSEERGQLINLVQMGDGAAACVVAPLRDHTSKISHFYFGQIGRNRKPGLTLGGGTDDPELTRPVLEYRHDYENVRASGEALFRHDVLALEQFGVDLSSMDHVIPHQANGRIDRLLSDALPIAKERVFVNADRIGNTGSAAIWIALAQLRPHMKSGARAAVLGAEATKHMFGGFIYSHA